ncbi:MAG TPA: hypothetical protein PLE75_10405 [Ferruginibacter sp.]|nr:hypothetical protein [Ferruginibacter sp.]HRO07085.1 hypothetical protein [Ferruginibacter sp.]HRO96368.1 hypothetical protein [Ferruginibacter sp.]HRP48473.1 hypothetical protein [Ferruginibacter sp.]
MHIKQLYVTGIVMGLMAASCSEPEQTQTPPPVVYKKDTATVQRQAVRPKAPVINIVDTVRPAAWVLVMKDSAAGSETIGSKMNIIYSEALIKVIEDKKLNITGPRMAWYRTSSPPFFFEAGYPVNKKPTGKLPKNIFLKELKNDSALVAHYYGPYDLTYQAYEALKEWMNDYKKKSAGAPYEVYIGSMYNEKGNPVDPYRVRTDIIFPYK